MSERVRVRTYNVGFGDCFLVTLPEQIRTRHMLVDFGNAIGKGGSNAPFRGIAEDVRRETNGHLDVVVMSHEHADHMEGFYSQRKTFDTIQVDNVWMSLPSHPDYYRDYPNARVHKRMKALADEFYRKARTSRVSLAPSFERLLRNNLSNKTRVEYVRDYLGATTWFLASGDPTRGAGLGRLKVQILAPEADVSLYYGREGHALSPEARTLAGSLASQSKDPWTFPGVEPLNRSTPHLVSESDWNRLRGKIRRSGVEVVRTIDKAQNDTSLVFTVEASGKTLLFPGDAELASWRMMASRRQLGPVDFLKVSHHGSHNGTPLDHLDTILPKRRKKRAVVVVSTQSKVYGTKNPVPNASLLSNLRGRCKKLHSTDGLSDPWIDIWL